MAVSETWEWFCGANSTDIDFGNTHESLTNDSFLGYPCLIDGVDTIPHIFFAVLASLLIFLLSVCTQLNNTQSKYLLRYPGHELRWLLLIASFILLAGSVGEGILTDSTYESSRATQPHLYLPQCCAIIATIVAMAFYQHIEMWQSGHMLWFVLLYWGFAFGAQTLRLLSLQDLDVGTVDTARFDFTLALLVVYGLLILLELNAIRAKVSFAM